MIVINKQVKGNEILARKGRKVLSLEEKIWHK